MTDGLTHFDATGASRMVDVGDKAVSARRATASCQVVMQPGTLRLVRDGGTAKGNPLEVARLAGIMATKQTGQLIPLCHPLGIDAAQIDFEFASENTIAIRSAVATTGRTGVEMEAMVAASIAALTLYDMLKSVDRTIEITQLRLDTKSGGRSGQWQRNPAQSSDLDS
jgi:cyclic pyranopterin phosphate synthase